MSEPAQIDERALRTALSHFATGVTVVTASTPSGERVGMTITSFNSVSLNPPLVLFSIGRTARSLPLLSAAKGYAINVLRHDQTELSGRFARSGGEKWQGVSHSLGFHGAPVIENTLMSFECEAAHQYNGGDHVIFVGRVLRFAQPDSGNPLLFYKGAYHGVIPQQSIGQEIRS